MKSNEENQELVECLQQRGHPPKKMIKIHLAEYDYETMRNSEFDTLDGGRFDLESTIRVALGEGS